MCVVRVALRSWRRKAKGAALWYLGPVDRHRGLFQGGDRVVISLYSLITRKTRNETPTRGSNTTGPSVQKQQGRGGDCPASPSQQLAELGSIPKENISPAEKRKAPMSRGLGGLSIIDSMCGGQVMKARPRSVVTAQRTSREEEEAAGEGTARLSTAPSARGCRRSRACRGTRAPRRWRASRARPPPPPSRSAATSAPPSRPR